jgi:transposase
MAPRVSNLCRRLTSASRCSSATVPWRQRVASAHERLIAPACADVFCRASHMNRYIDGEDQTQFTFLPECLDDDLALDKAARELEVFVDQLDLFAPGFDSAHPVANGRPAYDPSALPQTGICGHLGRIPSSRRLERQRKRNNAMMWLRGGPSPDCRTIAGFHRDNGSAIRDAGASASCCVEARSVVAVDRHPRWIQVRGEQPPRRRRNRRQTPGVTPDCLSPEARAPGTGLLAPRSVSNERWALISP